MLYPLSDTATWIDGQLRVCHIPDDSKYIYYIDTDEIPGFFLLLKNHIFIVRSEDTIFIFHV